MPFQITKLNYRHIYIKPQLQTGLSLKAGYLTNWNKLFVLHYRWRSYMRQVSCVLKTVVHPPIIGLKAMTAKVRGAP